MAVIERESEAWLKGDVEKWADCWLQNERAQHVNARPSVGARLLFGFDEIRDYFSPGILDNRSNPQDAVRISRDNWRISVSQDMAWATFDQLMPLDAVSDHAPGRHNEMRILEKVDGRWKIAALFQIPNRIGYYEMPWVRVDGTGRIIEMGAGADVMLARHGSLRVIGRKLGAMSAPDAERLRKALATADDLVRRRIGAPPAALLLSDPESGAISVAWVTIADMMIVILLGNDRLLSQSIADAGAVYRLTKTQMRVAEAIARGNDLSRVAESLGIQPNTVRTHVKRMFERVEVNSQTALISALLSTKPPRP